jgi:hypothetical protein
MTARLPNQKEVVKKFRSSSRVDAILLFSNKGDAALFSA